MSIILTIFGFIIGILATAIFVTYKLIGGVKYGIKGTGKIAKVIFKVVRKA